METADVIRAARERAGMSQRQLAEQARTSQSAIARYESGQMTPSTEVLGRLLDACGINLGAMLRRAPTDAGRSYVQDGASVGLRSILDLATVDERVRRFTPLGLATSHMLRPDAAVEFQQRVMAEVVLAPDVPEGTRAIFERLRQLYVYGCFQYDFFTVAHDLAPLVLEAALSERFIAQYGGTIPMVDRTTGTVETFQASNFQQVYDQVNGLAFRKRSRWSLQTSDRASSMPFAGNLTDLMDWARMEGLLKGQRNRMLEPVLVRIRNRSAHATGFHLLMPPDAARTIRDIAEIINHLWGHSTPGGRLYSSPLKREPVAIGWNQSRTETGLFARHHLEASEDRRDWTFLIVRAVYEDPNLWHYDREFESTAYPVEYLWGPGDFEAALNFLANTQPSDDEVSYLDRLFVVGELKGTPDPPRRPEVFISLNSDTSARRWHLIKADFPVDAYTHVRNCPLSDSKCSHDVGPCLGCAAEVLLVGSDTEVAAELRSCGINEGENPGGVRVPVGFRLWP
jgi:transcriptional regulator with XRE-family HTH domain